MKRKSTSRRKRRSKPEPDPVPLDPIEAMWYELQRSRDARARAVEGLDEVELETAMLAAHRGMMDIVKDRLIKGALRQKSGVKHHVEQSYDPRPGRAWRNTEWIFGDKLYNPLEDD